MADLKATQGALGTVTPTQPLDPSPSLRDTWRCGRPEGGTTSRIDIDSKHTLATSCVYAPATRSRTQPPPLPLFCPSPTTRARAEEAESRLSHRLSQGEEVREEEWCDVMQAWSQAGDVTRAHQVMDMCGVTVSGLNILMHFHARRGRVEESERVLRRMQDEGLCPSVGSYNSLLHAYVKRGGNSHRRLPIGDLQRVMEVRRDVLI